MFKFLFWTGGISAILAVVCALGSILFCTHHELLVTPICGVLGIFFIVYASVTLKYLKTHHREEFDAYGN